MEGQERVSVDGTKVTVEIDLASLWVGGVNEDGTTFPMYVAARAAAALLSDVELASSKAELRRRVAAITDAEIRERLRPLLHEALERLYQPTDSFGTPKGEPKTLHEAIVELARKELTEKRGDSFRGRDKTTIVEDFVKAEVQDALGKELRATVSEAKVQVIAAVRDRAGEVIAETIERVAAGRSV